MNFQEKLEICLKWHLRTLIWLLVHQHIPACHFSMANCGNMHVLMSDQTVVSEFAAWWFASVFFPGDQHKHYNWSWKYVKFEVNFAFHGSKTRELSLTFNSMWSQLLNLMNSHRCGRRLQHAGTMSLTISQSHLLQTVSRRNLSETRSPRGMTTPRCCPVAESGHAATWWPHLSCWALSKVRLTVECFASILHIFCISKVRRLKKVLLQKKRKTTTCNLAPISFA